MQVHRDSQASAGTKRPDPTATEASPHAIRLTIRRAAMNCLLVQLRSHHHALSRRGLASAMSERSHDELTDASFSHTARSGLNTISPSPEPEDAFDAARQSRSSGQFRHGGSFFFPGSFSLSLAEPPAEPPLRGWGAFGSSLKGILPTVPSSQPAPPPFSERAIPLLKIKKGTICPPRTLQPPRPAAQRRRRSLAG
jgi:hypothetical protein